MMACVKLRKLDFQKQEIERDDLLIDMDALRLTPTPLEARIERAKNGKGAKPEPTTEAPALQ
jgi:hypothetical protein